MKQAPLLALCLLAAAPAGAAPSAPLYFSGMCDASAAVALDNDLFAVGNDEDNVLRFYRLSQPGAPLHTHNLNPFLFGKKKAPEADLEGAARLGTRVYWIASHGRNAAGQFAPNRHLFFALEMRAAGSVPEVRPLGRPYTRLVDDLARDPRLQEFRLAEAASRAPKTQDALNIEALTDTPEGTLLMGFRNPIPRGRALVVPLLNPAELTEGKQARFGNPILLDLGGYGLRAMGSTEKGYYLVAGPAEAGATSRIFHWDGVGASPKPLAKPEASGFNLEGLCFHDATGRTDFLVLSDDGSLVSQNQECKSLPENQRKFRAVRLAH